MSCRILTAPGAPIVPSSIDHGLLGGLDGDDHLQYALADKSRPAVWVEVADLAVRSIADLGTKDHDLLDGLADDDHTQYALADKTRPSPWVSAADLSVRSIGDLGTKDHDLLDGLADDDHTQYALADKSRPAVWVSAADLAARSLADLGTKNFLQLSDTPGSFTANRPLKANAGATAVVHSTLLFDDGSFFGVGTATAVAATDIANFQKNQNQATRLRVRNSTSNTLARSHIEAQTEGAGNDVVVSIQALSTGITAGGIDVQGAAVLRAIGADLTQLNIGSAAAVDIVFYTSDVEAARIVNTTTGGFFKATALTNGQRAIRCNAGSGNNQATFLFTRNDAFKLAIAHANAGAVITGAVIGPQFRSFTSETWSFAVDGSDAPDMTWSGVAGVFRLFAASGNALALGAGGAEKVRLLTSGEFLVNRTTAFVAGTIAEFGNNQNAASGIRVVNTTTGTLAESTFFFSTGSGGDGRNGSIRMSSKDFTLAFGHQPEELALCGATSLGTISVALITQDEGVIRFVTNATERIRVLGNANTLQGNAGLTIEGGAGVHTLTLSGGASAASSIAIGIANELIGAFGASPVVRPTGVAVTAAGIHAALVSLGWITA